MKKLFALLLALVMLVSLTACGSSASKLLVGTWEGVIDLSGQMAADMAKEDPDMAQYFDFSCYQMKMVFEFGSDGIYKSYVDEASYNEATEQLGTALEDGLYAYFEAMIKDMGLGDISVDDLLAASNTTMDALLADFYTQMSDPEAIESFSNEGHFKAKDGKLWLSAGLEYKVDEAVYDTYALDGSTLTLLSTTDPNATEETLALYPMTFTKK